MNRLKEKNISSFTLIELLAAMFVFSIMLTLSIQLFNSARELWVRSEQRTNHCNDLRMTMDFIATRLQSVSYQEDMFFELKKNEIYFASNLYIHNRKSDSTKTDKYQTRFYYIGLTNNDLVLKIFSDSMYSNFAELLPPYKNETAAVYAVDEIKNKFTEIDSASELNYNVLLGNVIELEFISENPPTPTPPSPPPFPLRTPPRKITVKLTVMDSKENLDLYNEDETTPEKKQELKALHGHTIQRIIMLPDYTRKED